MRSRRYGVSTGISYRDIDYLRSSHRSRATIPVAMNGAESLFEFAEEGYDLAIRVTQEPPPTMVAPQLTPINRVVGETPKHSTSTASVRSGTI